MKIKRAYQKFCIIAILVAVVVLLCNLIIWHNFTSQIKLHAAGIFTGDLAAKVYLHDHTAPRKDSRGLSRKYVDYADYSGQKVDVITIGDSLSQGQGHGPNRYYQDYIATLQNLTVLNVSVNFPEETNIIENIATLINSGAFEHINPQFLLLQSIESNTYHFGQTVNLGKTLPLNQIESFLDNHADMSGEYPPSVPPETGFMNPGNFKWLWYNLCYHFSPNALTSDVYLEKLDRPFFTGDKGQSLLFSKRDYNKYIDKSQALDERAVRRINDNLNRLASFLAEKSIRLIFMPVPDKYSIYRPYLVEKRHSRSAFFEHLRWQPKSYQLIDTDAILAQELKQGVKDLYWLDDTHWSWKAAKTVFEQFRIK